MRGHSWDELAAYNAETSRITIIAYAIMGILIFGLVVPMGDSKGQSWQVFPYETGEYCKSVADGITIKVAQPKILSYVGESISEQWISGEDLSNLRVLIGAETANLTRNAKGLYELQLPTGVTCQVGE